MTEEILICNGRVIAETHYLPKGYVFIKNGKIASIGEDWSEIFAEEVIDVQGLIISPGFIDIHTHGIKDVDFMESDPENIARGLSEYAHFGVTRVVGSTLSNPFEQIISQAKRIRAARENRDYGDILLGVHIEGPWLTPSQRGGHALHYLQVPKKDDIYRLLNEVGDVIRTVTFAPELPNAVWLTEQLSYHGIVGVLGHTEASYEETERVILAGVRHVTHLYDASHGFKENPNEALVMMPGLETAVVMHDDVSIELIGCPVHVPKPFFRYIDKVKPRNKKVIVTDSLVGTGMPDGTTLTYRDGRKVYVSEGVLRMIDDDPNIHGNLTGSAVTMNVALRRLKEYTNLPVSEAIRWGSINPATTLGIDNETGSISIGKYADLAIIDEEFDVKMTFLKGKLVYKTQ